MRRAFLAIVIILLSAAAFTGCDNGYRERIDEMTARVDSLEAQCSRYNAILMSIKTMAQAVQEKDMVTGTSLLKDDSGKTIGYRIFFLHREPVSLYNGTAGSVPYVGSTKGSDGIYYWTVSYNGGEPVLLKDTNGNPVPCMGQVPYIIIRNKSWYITYDGVTYEELGPASGEDADAMFKSFQVGTETVRVIMSNGTVYEWPLFAVYSALRSQLDQINANAEAQAVLVRAMASSWVSITDISVTVDGKDTISTHIELSNGDKCDIYSVRQSNVPVITLLEDSTDGKYYWAMAYGDQFPQWITDATGKRIQAVSDEASTPVIGMMKDDEDGHYYWTIKIGDADPVFIYDEKGSGQRVQAILDAAGAIFADVDMSDPVWVTIRMISGEIYRLPRIFSVEIETEIEMAPGASISLPYKVYGDDNRTTTVSAMTQDGFSVHYSNAPVIIIDSPADFSSTSGQVILVFNICNTGTRTVLKTINIRPL